MESKKVVFVEPRGAYSNVFAQFMTIPLLGPIYLATIAEQAGYDASVFNENIAGRNITEKELESIDILCLSCITATSTRGKEIAAQYKEIRSNNSLESRTIIGGIHASTIPEDVIPYFDQVVIGEGENIILDLLAGKITDKVVYAQRPENLDALPMPNFKLVEDWKKIKTIPVSTSRGCPYGCNFCAVTEMFGRNYRFQSPERVVDEIMNYDARSIFFVDDNFAANLARVMKISELMKERGFNMPWSTQVRADVTRAPEVVSQMRKSGCHIVYIGFESINNESLKDMKKSQTLNDIERAIKVFHGNGIGIHGMFMLGGEADKKDVFQRTSEFCNRNKLESIQMAVETGLPGTQFYRQLEAENRILHRRWELYDGLHVMHAPRHMTPYELQQGMIRCFSDFYSLTGGIKKAVNTFLDSAVATGKSLYSRVHFPSFYPVGLKIMGSGIVKRWVAHNREYLEYLKNISHLSPAKALQ